MYLTPVVGRAQRPLLALFICLLCNNRLLRYHMMVLIVRFVRTVNLCLNKPVVRQHRKNITVPPLCAGCCLYKRGTFTRTTTSHAFSPEQKQGIAQWLRHGSPQGWRSTRYRGVQKTTTTHARSRESDAEAFASVPRHLQQSSLRQPDNLQKHADV